MKKTIEELANDLIEAKLRENEANEKRVAIEREIIALIGCKEEGSTTHKLANGLSITTTGKLSYSCDIDELMQLCEKIPEDLRPIKTKNMLDETGLKYLRQNEPELYKKIAKAITTKPAKPSVSLKA